MNLRSNRNILVLAIALATLTGCSEFPCESRASAHDVPTVTFSDGDEVRYVYWFEDGAQRLTTDHEEVPEAARPAVIVHVTGKTDAELHGATGWVANVDELPATAAFVPMARARTAVYASWAGSWTARWLQTRAVILADNIELSAQLREETTPDDVAPAEPTSDDPLDPLRLIENLRGEQGEDDMPTRPAAPAHAPRDLAKQLDTQGLSIDEMKVTRALRVVGARQPLPRDFGLSVDVHSSLLFVAEGCAACDEAMAWLDERNIGYHAMLITDPTNAATLRNVAQHANIKPAVPLLWHHTQVLRGFDRATWEKELR